MAELLTIEQRRGRDDASHWVREGERRLPGLDSNRRIAAVREGLVRHAGARELAADAADEEVERVLRAIHDRDYLDALAEIDSEAPVVLPGFAPPGLEPDIPVSSRLVAAAREGVRTSVSAARRNLDGAEFTYALCRPPGHHAGPAFQAGYCYLNNAAAAVRTLLDGSLGPVGVLDLDLHYPNGTSAVLERMPEATLHSLHAEPVTNLPPDATLPRVDGERTVSFPGSPDPERYLSEVAISVGGLAERAAALVVSLGYDTVRGDPHGGWEFEPALFAEVGRLLAAAARPVCVVQEGGYALGVLPDCAGAFASGLLDGAPPTFVVQGATKDRSSEGAVAL
jgi:acetoin utilization deacetylase AcuC-like enzyme